MILQICVLLFMREPFLFLKDTEKYFSLKEILMLYNVRIAVVNYLNIRLRFNTSNLRKFDRGLKIN